MADIIQFPAAKCAAPEPEPVETAPEPIKPHPQGILASFFRSARGTSIDLKKLHAELQFRQGKILDEWASESVEHLGLDAVIELLESMAAHLKNDKRGRE